MILCGQYSQDQPTLLIQDPARVGGDQVSTSLKIDLSKSTQIHKSELSVE